MWCARVAWHVTGCVTRHISITSETRVRVSWCAMLLSHIPHLPPSSNQRTVSQPASSPALSCCECQNLKCQFYILCPTMTYAASFIFNCQALLTLLLPYYNNTAQSVMRWTQSPTLAERKSLIERLWVSAKPDKIAVTLSRHRVCIEILLS